ncbi:MAG TPA: signal peptidase I [Treponemataceae bacterium]|nr:signal peptidase I [Treponemataceae bacterium]
MTKHRVITMLFLGLLIGFILKVFVFDIVKISGTSMQPAIQEGDMVVIWKLAYGLVKPFSPYSFTRWKEPKQGDIIAYLHNNKIVIKRCLATEGMHLSFSSLSGYHVRIQIKETDTVIPLSEKQYQRLKMTTTVPAGFLFAVGDNYEDSIDSRDYGFVAANEVTGKVLCK